MKKYFVLFIFLSACFSVYADNYFQDTLWQKKTDQSEGFYMLKFSQNDSIIAGFGYENTIFYEAKTGNEINRINGYGYGFFINNDMQFIRVASGNKTIEILDTKSWDRIDTMQNDGLSIGKFDISSDSKFLISVIPKGIRIWDLITKKIIKTRIYPDEENMTDMGLSSPKFLLNNNIIVQMSKTYNIPNSTPPQTKTIGDFIILNLSNLDSIGSLGNHRYYVLSKNNKYIAYGTGDNNYGIEVYDFQTKKLLYKFPVNGLNVTGLEFTSDEKYLVTADQYNNMNTWDISNGKQTFEYINGCTSNFNISHNQKYIIWSCSRLLSLYNAYYTNTSVIDPTNTTNTMYPNPTNGIVTITNSCLLPQMHYSISNQSGQILNSSTIQNVNNQIQLNFSQYPSGTYYINLQCNQELTNYKIIKE